ncbi:protein arginine kinase [Risungbinella massiliensis]|uniref:protein arginine kinase n=1 Tax=Risungbinella massiliensis TaxID=1329796 RepID=UPI0005CB938F|nr:protein arginine kinase [Risungbinella massiliensis]
MSLHRFLQNAISEWMRVKGPESDIIFSSRIRLARNLTDLPFPMLSNSSQAEQVVEMVEAAWKEDPPEVLKDAELVRMKDLSDLEKRVLVEKHLISPHLAEDSEYGAVLLNQDESVSIMLNEEDHIRIQCLFPGLQLKLAGKLASELDDWLERHLNIAFEENYGYVTSCPTNFGTGIRASVMIHLPALAMTQQLNRILPAITQVGLAVRGIYGEGSEALGQLYQVSNQVTLGPSEEEILEKLEGVVAQMINQEENARERLRQLSSVQLEDRFFRAFGILQHARVMDSKEAMRRLSDVRLGIDMGFIKDLPSSVMNELMVVIQPGFLQLYAGEKLGAEERDMRRAELIRERMRINDFPEEFDSTK